MLSAGKDFTGVIGWILPSLKYSEISRKSLGGFSHVGTTIESISAL